MIAGHAAFLRGRGVFAFVDVAALVTRKLHGFRRVTWGTAVWHGRRSRARGSHVGAPRAWHVLRICSERTEAQMTEIWRRESRAAVVGLTLLRMVTGVILAAHGWEKLVGYSDWQNSVASLGLPMPHVLAPLAIAAELGGGVGLVLGLLTRLAGLGAAINMGVAIATVHWGHGLFAKDNGFEFPLLLLVSALFFLLRGAGAASLDSLWSRHGDRIVAEPDRRQAGDYSAPRRHQHQHT